VQGHLQVRLLGQLQAMCDATAELCVRLASTPRVTLKHPPTHPPRTAGKHWRSCRGLTTPAVPSWHGG
jgi:hypothetical protein